MGIYTLPSQNAMQTTLGGNLALGETGSLTLAADWSSYLSTVSASRPFVLVIDRVNASGTKTPTVREYLKCTGISGTTVSGLTRGRYGSTAQAHTAGAIVELVMDAETLQSIIDGFDVEHTPSDGTHDATKVGMLAGTQTFTGDKTFSGAVVLSGALSGTSIKDEDTMSSDSATAVPTQQSTKAYVDTSIAAISSVPKKARVYKDSSQSVNHNTATALTFNQEVLDNDTIHDNVTNNSRLTIKTAGLYLFKAQVSFANNTTGVRNIFINKNGANTNLYVNLAASTGGDRTTGQISGIIDAAVNDYFEVVVYQGSGGALNIEGGASDPYYASGFECVRLGASS